MPVAYTLGLAAILGALWIDVPLEAVMIQVSSGVNSFSLLAIPFFVLAGALHFVKPRMYEAIVPPWLPRHRELVYASGLAEIAGGLGMLPERTARWAAFWLIATLIGVFPANVNMAVQAERFRNIPEPLLWARLPLQALLVGWVWSAVRRRAERANCGW